ncbi:MAG: hypothetical protein IKS10_09040 [Lachnospiraceae bacterium]|nr:hypothetical protein [Lachnospiraceae bacterium]
MKQKGHKGYKRSLSLLLIVALFFALAATGIGEPLGFVRPVEAAGAAFPDDLNQSIVQAGVQKMGQGYSESPNISAGLYDCSSLVRKCLEENQFGNVPSGSRNWVNQISAQSLNLTYKGSALSASQYVYCANVTQFKTQLNNNANKGKVIVLTSPVDHNTLAQNGVLKEGAIEVYYTPGDRMGHTAIIVGNIQPKGVPTGTSYTSDQLNYAEQKYAKQAFTYLADRYQVPKAVFHVNSATTALMQASVNNGAGNYGAYTLASGYTRNGSPGFYQFGGQSLPNYNIWTTNYFTRPQADWSVLQIFNKFNLHAYGDSTVWKIEALSPRFGVTYTNSSVGYNASNTTAYVVYFKDWASDYYYGLTAQQFTVDGTTSFSGPAPGYSSAGCSVPGLGGGKTAISVAVGINAEGLTNYILQNHVIDTPRGTTVNLFSAFPFVGSTLAVYIHEESSVYGTARPGVWKLLLAGSGDPNANTQIVTATYYSSYADCVNDTNGVAIANENGLTSEQMIEKNRTAMFGQGTATTNPNFEMIDAFEIQQPSVVEGTGHLALTKTEENGQASEPVFSVDVYAEDAYSNGKLSGPPVQTLTAENGELVLDVSALAEEVNASGSGEDTDPAKSFYLKEGGAPEGYSLGETYLHVVVTEDEGSEDGYYIEVRGE